MKGLVDAGLTKIPWMFIEERQTTGMITWGSTESPESVPVIDFKDMDKDAAVRTEIIKKVGEACEKWGFYQVVNHGIPESVLNGIIDGIGDFMSKMLRPKRNGIPGIPKRKLNLIAILIFINHAWPTGGIPWVV